MRLPGMSSSPEMETQGQNEIDISSEDEPTPEAPQLNGSMIVYKNQFRSIEFPRDSIKCLESGSYLTDHIVEFYLVYLLDQICPEHIVKKIHIFDSIFHGKLEKVFVHDGIDKREYNRLHKWYEGVDVFEKDFLIFPICAESHWKLIIVGYPSSVETFQAEADNDIYHIEESDEANISNKNYTSRNPAIIVMDSLGLTGMTATMKVRDFLDYEWRARLESIKRFSHYDLGDHFPKLTKQKNTFDCGLYMLMYIRCFLEDPYKNYKLIMKNDQEAMKPFNNRVNELLQVNNRDAIKNLVLKACK